MAGLRRDGRELQGGPGSRTALPHPYGGRVFQPGAGRFCMGRPVQSGRVLRLHPSLVS